MKIVFNEFTNLSLKKTMKVSLLVFLVITILNVYVGQKLFVAFYLKLKNFFFSIWTTAHTGNHFPGLGKYFIKHMYNIHPKKEVKINISFAEILLASLLIIQIL